MIAVLHHPDSLDHQPGPHHPEHPDRLRWALEALEAPGLPPWTPAECPMAPLESLTLAHSQAHVEMVASLAGRRVTVDADTVTSPGSVRATLRAAGGALAAVDLVLTDRVDAAFVLARPPGHHAERGRAMGFCLANHAALAAAQARLAGVERVAVLDWDVHHGNGTQDVFRDRPDVLFASSHQAGAYPGTGAAWDVGHEAGQGTTRNAPLPAGCDDATAVHAWEELLLPAVEAFAPGLIVLSAGYDAHRADPLGGLAWTEAAFGRLALAVRGLAHRVAQGRVVVLLEGGYSPTGLRGGLAATLRGLAGDAPPVPPPGRAARDLVRALAEEHERALRALQPA